MKDDFIDMNIDDALIEKPYGFTIEEGEKGERRFFLYPVTLGKLHLLQRHLSNLEINEENLKLQPYLEALRIVREKRSEVCKYFAYLTFKRKRDLFDNELVESRQKEFEEFCTEEDLSSLLIYVLTKDDVEAFKKHLGISRENERMSKVVAAKESAQKSKNDFSFGGKTAYGLLIDTACERYGWTYEYVLWGISFVNLQMLLADRVQTVYLTDDEKKKIPKNLLSGDKVINADDKRNMEQILSMNWK